MRDFSKWQDSAAEEALERLLKIAENICTDINNDLGNTNKNLKLLKYSWSAISNIMEKKKENNVLKNIIKPEDKFNRKLPSIDDYITSPVKL